MDIGLKLARIKTKLLGAKPFFGSAALNLPFAKTKGMDTMATDGRFIYYGDEFVEKQTEQDLMGVVAHEVLHVIFKHHLRRGERDPMLWNMACDYAINLILTNDGFTMPEGVLLDRKYTGWTAEAIYKDLEENQPEGDGQGPGEGQGWGDFIEPDGSMSKADVKKHSMEIDRIINQAAEAAKGKGDIPGGLEELIAKTRAPQVNWKELIRNECQGHNPDDFTWNRPNRKFFGTYGMYLPAIKKTGAGHWVVAIDTSGSVRQDELKAFINEISGIAEDVRPSCVTLICCDTKINSVAHYYDGEPIPDLKVIGRGGTAFTPVFDWIAENNVDVEQVIYFSDLRVYREDFGPEQPYPVMWATTDAEIAPWGKVVKIEVGKDVD